MRRFIAAVLGIWLIATGAFAQSLDGQEVAEEDNGYFISLLEEQLSSESRKIRLSGIDGLLSSRATVKRITISDSDGVWLQIDNATLDWNRRALLGGAVQINELKAERIWIPRQPLPEPGLPEASSSGGFSVPDLPVSLNLEELAVDRIELGEALFGAEVVIAAAGTISLDGTALKAALTLDRLDGVGGRFALNADVSGDPVQVNFSLDAAEPQGGVVATLMGLDGQPPMDVSVKATGPLEGLEAEVDLKVDTEDLLDGRFTLTGSDAGFAAELSLTGRLQPLLPPAMHSFFGGESTVDATARQVQDGGFTLDRLSVRTSELAINGALTTAADGFPTALELTANIGTAGGPRVVLPTGGADVSVQSGTLSLSYGVSDRWSGAVVLEALQSGDNRFETAWLDMTGQAVALQDPDARQVTGDIDGVVTGFSGAADALRSAFGEAIELGVDFDWRAGQPLLLRQARVTGGDTEVGLRGLIDGSEFSGRASLVLPDMAALGSLTGGDYGGALSAEVSGKLDAVAGGFDLELSGSSEDLALGIAQFDPLFTGKTSLSGRIERSEAGLRADGVELINAHTSVTANGVYSAAGTDFDFDAVISDIARITSDGAGRVSLSGRAVGQNGGLGLEVSLQMAEGRLMQRAVSGAELAISANGRGATDLSGVLSGGGTLDGAPLDLSGRFALSEGLQRLQEFALQLGRTAVTGTLARGADGIVAGRLDILSPDLSEPAALALTQATGAVEARATLFRSAGRQMLTLDAALADVGIAGITLGQAEADLRLQDLFGIPLADGTVRARDAQVAGYGLETLNLSAETQGEAMRVELDTRLDNGVSAEVGGVLERLGGSDLALELDRLTVVLGAEEVALRSPARLEVRSGELDLSGFDIAIAGGSLRAAGRVGAQIALDLDMQALRLDLVNQLVPDLRVAGVLDGSAKVTGTLAAPEGQFDISARDLSAAALIERGLPPLALITRGTLSDGAVALEVDAELGVEARMTLKGSVPLDPQASGLGLEVALDRLALPMLDTLAGEQGLQGEVTGRARLSGRLAQPVGTVTLRGADISSSAVRSAGLGSIAVDMDATLDEAAVTLDALAVLSGGGRLALAGSVPMDTAGDGLDLKLELAAFPLASVDALAGSPGLTGTLSASAEASGRLAAPAVRFEAQADALSVTALRAEGIGALQATVSGAFSENTVALDEVQMDGPGGLNFSAGGRVPLSGNGLDLRVDGVVPLSLADVALARSQSQLQGQLSLSGRAGGSLTAPDINGQLSISGATFVNAPANIRLNDIALNASISGTQLTIASASAALAQGGTIAVSGGLGLSQGLPADLNIAIREAFYTDGSVVTTEASGGLSLTGPLLGAGTVRGDILLERTEISLRGGFGINAGVLLDVRHRSPPRDVVLTLDRARVDELRAEAAAADRGSSLGLDVLVRVPNKLFVRGRGVDAELGGQVRIRGTTANIAPIGTIELIRGRLNILGQRIDFDEGEVTLVGDLEPRIRLVAETESSDGTVITITVSGVASDPEIVLSSSPELPEDEVLAQLIFNRNVSELSPFQVAQLAAAVATLTGGGGGLVGGFRSAVGLADLDITTGENGDVGVRAGAYISDNIYLDLEADSAGGSEATVNIDFSKYFTGKLSVDNRGESSVGVFFQRDY